MEIAGPDGLFVSGSVGIGIMGPGEALDVVGNAHVSGSFIAGNTTTYSDGSITLSAGTNLNVDSNTLFVGNANNRVGIGTTTPFEELDVSALQNAGISITSTTGGAAQWSLYSISSDPTRLGFFEIQRTSGSPDTIPFTIEPTAPHYTLYLDGAGEVGIGTPSPLAKLHVQGISAGVTGDGGSNIMFGDEAGIRNEIAFRSQSDTNNRVFHKVAINNSGDNTTVMTLMGSGNVGIGITAPAHALDVVGDAHVSGSFIAGNTTTYGDGDISFTGPNLLINGGKVGIGTTNTTSISNGRLYVGGGHVIVDNNSGFLSLNSSASGIGAGIDTGIDHSLIFFADGAERAIISPQGFFGIGDQTPGVLLDVRDAPGGSSAGRVRYQSTFDDNAEHNFVFDNTTAHPYYAITDGFGNVTTRISSQGTSYLTSTDASVQTRLGIGTLSPAANLHVGKQEAPSSTTGTVARLALQPYGHTGGPWVFDARDVSSNAFLDLKYGGLSPALTIKHSNSGVGLGTTDPDYQLHLKGGRLHIEPTISGGNGTLQFSTAGVGGGAAQYHFYTHTGNTLRISNAGGGSDIFTINQSGNLTILGNLTELSDARLKTNVQAITSPLEKVLALRGVTFNKTSDESQRAHVGLIAQEVEQVLPEVVHTNPEGYKSVAYANIVGVLVEAIKELEARVAELEAQ